MKKKIAKPENFSKQSKTTTNAASGTDPRYVMERLDQSLPLVTEDWKRVEQLLNMFTEFAPTDMVMELAGAIANYADDQAKRGYLLGQEDMVKEVRRLVA